MVDDGCLLSNMMLPSLLYATSVLSYVGGGNLIIRSLHLQNTQLMSQLAPIQHHVNNPLTDIWRPNYLELSCEFCKSFPSHCKL